jgi:hypothetical protein
MEQRGRVIEFGSTAVTGSNPLLNSGIACSRREKHLFSVHCESETASVLYHSLLELATRNFLGCQLSWVTCPRWRLFAQVNCRSEKLPIAFPEPAPFFQ